MFSIQAAKSIDQGKDLPNGCKNTVCTMEKFISQFTFRSTVVPPKLARNSEANQKKKERKFIAGQKECRRVVTRVNLCDEVATRFNF